MFEKTTLRTYYQCVSLMIIVTVGVAAAASTGYSTHESASSEPSLSISWTLGSHFPDLIKGGAMGIVDNYLVYVGGSSYPWRERETGWYLDLQAGDWKPLPPMPEGRCYTSGVTVVNSLYVIGGRKVVEGRFEVHRNCYRLTRKDGVWRWDILPELQQARAAPALASVDDVIYCIGGGSWITGAFSPDDVPIDEYLDLNNLEAGWHQMPTCPGMRRADAMIASVRGKIYVFGGGYARIVDGQLEGVRLRDAWCFDPKTWKWQEIASLPVNGMTGAVALTYEDRYIILVGGAIPEEPNSLGAVITYQEDETRGVQVGYYNSRVLVYDVETNTYEELTTPLPFGVHDVKAVILNDIIYTVGGECVDRSVSHTSPHVQIGKVRKTQEG